MKRIFTFLLLVTLVACGQTTATQTPATPVAAGATAIPAPSTTSAAAPAAFPVSIENCGVSLTYTAAPQRAVTMTQNVTEVMLALGLQDRMVGTASRSAPILPEYAAAYAAIPVLSDKYPALEVLLAAEPDFVYGGYTSVFEESSGRSREDLKAKNINSFLATEYCADGPVTMEMLYTDIRNIGAIFGVRDRAEALVTTMQTRITAVRASIGTIATPLRVFVYDSGDQVPATAGGEGISNEMIKLAGGSNIFDDLVDEFGDVSWEEVVKRDPEVILIYDYGDTTAEAKRDALLQNPALANVAAIKNQRFLVLPLSSTVAGVRNSAAVEQIAQALYPQAFGAGTAPSANDVVSIENCGETVSYAKIPERAVTVDVNISEMMLALGLQDRMAGIGGVATKGDILAEFQPAFEQVPSISEKYPTLEVLLGANPDFVFAGWNYGFSEEKGLTPTVLNERGIATYILTESCIRKGSRPPITIEDTFTDLRNLGKIFRVEDRATALIAGYERELSAVQAALPKRDTPLRVFVYDSGEATPFTAASEAIPTNLISLAGGANIINDIKDSWVTVGWETVIERNPEMIVIVDYGTPNAEGKMNFLLNNPALAGVDAIKNKRFVVLPYAAATPGPRNAAAVRTLAEAFFPQAFK